MNGAVRRLVFMSMAAIVRSAPVEQNWIWDGYLAPGALTLLAGRPKVGKSTFLFALMAAICRGAEFCAGSTRQVPIAILSEERIGSFNAKARMTEWPEGIDVALRQHTYGMEWPDIVAGGAKHAGPGGLLIVDTVAEFAQLPADAENSAGAVQNALRPLLLAAETGCAVLAVVHQRKATGEHGEAIRGSNAAAAVADIVIELERVPAAVGEAARVVKAVSRFGNDLDDLVVVRTGSGYEARGELAGASAAAERERIFDALRTDGGVSADQLSDMLGISKATVGRHMQALLAAGRVTRDGRGVPRHPFLWSARLDSSIGLSSGRIESPRAAATEPTPPHLPVAPAGPSGEPMLDALHEAARSEPRWLPLGESGS